MNSSLILLLHAHLPYVNHPEYEYALEENWLFEAIWETYIPLIEALEGMAGDGVSPQLTLSFSPTLMDMLNDPQLRKRFVRHMDNLIALSGAEKKRTAKSPFGPVASLYNDRFRRAKRSYLEKYGQDLISAFRRLQDGGHIEILATSATHAFLPAFGNSPGSVSRQISVGVESYTRNFGRRPAGFWLPECGFFKGLDSFLRDEGIRYFFLESHGVLNGRPCPRYGVNMPVSLPSGLVAFGRDPVSSSQVWCATRGYPGDPFYRDFYRDIGFDLPSGYIDAHTRLNGIKTFTGIKYHRITEKTDDKLPYDRPAAMQRVSEHARHFIESRDRDFGLLSGCPQPLVLSAFDAELFGHWWFEGVEWLEALLRTVAESETSFRVSTPSGYLEKLTEKPDVVDPSPSSWGEGGYNALWIGEKNHYLYRGLHRMEDMMDVMREKRPGETGERVIAQAGRELLLAQASDWAFLIQRGSASEYAESRVRGHTERFNLLFSMLMGDSMDYELLSGIESRDRVFDWLGPKLCR